MLKDKYTVKQAAAYLGTTRQRINKFIKRGLLVTESSPIDGRYKLIDKEQLDAIKKQESLLSPTQEKSDQLEDDQNE